MKTNKRAKQKYTQRERAGANDIIFIFVNEFRTHKKLLTSALYDFQFLDVDNQTCCLRGGIGEDADDEPQKTARLAH